MNNSLGHCLLSIQAGPRAGKWALLPFQLAVLVGIAITYTVLGAENLALFASNVAPAGTPLLSTTQWAIVFGAGQVLLSMVSERQGAPQ
jgi:hypothetical protein